MSTWVIALECYEIDPKYFQPVEIALLNVTDGFCYTYHIKHSPPIIDRHKLIARHQFDDHGLNWQDGMYTFDWVKETLREHLHSRYMDIVYVFNPRHLHLIKSWFPHLKYIYTCPFLPLGDKSHYVETCALHKQHGKKLSCARCHCFQAAEIIEKF